MYLNLVQIAESFGVSESVIEGWIRDEGLPHTPDRGRLLFDRAQVAQWAATRGLASQAGFLAPEHSALSTMLRLEPLLRRGGIWRDVPPEGVTAVFERVAAALPGVTPPVLKHLSQRLRAPGGVTMAPIGGGFALPHPSTRITLGRDAGIVALICIRGSIVLDESVDGVPLTRLLFFIAPSPRAHLDLLARLGRQLARGPVADLIRSNAPDASIFAAVAAVDGATPSEPTS